MINIGSIICFVIGCLTSLVLSLLLHKSKEDEIKNKWQQYYKELYKHYKEMTMKNDWYLKYQDLHDKYEFQEGELEYYKQAEYFWSREYAAMKGETSYKATKARFEKKMEELFADQK